jgi:hypothetical protein
MFTQSHLTFLIFDTLNIEFESANQVDGFPT